MSLSAVRSATAPHQPALGNGRNPRLPPRTIDAAPCNLEAASKGTMIHDTPFGERRLHKRIICTFSIHIEDDRRSYMAYLRDLSLGGALVEPPPYFTPRIGQRLRLTIPFRKKAGVAVVNGKVLQTRKDGMAVSFLR